MVSGRSIHRNCIRLARDLFEQFNNGFEIPHQLNQNTITFTLNETYSIVVSIPEINPNMVGSVEACEMLGMFIEVHAVVTRNGIVIPEPESYTYVLKYNDNEIREFCIRMRDKWLN